MREIVDAVSRAVMIEEGCGCTITETGEHVLCDDDRLGEYRSRKCECKSVARAAIKATIEHLQSEVGRMTIEVTNKTENLPTDVRRILDACFKEDVKDIMSGFLSAMLSQAIKDMES
jgi:ethanolamine utilization cobalamin adenosyltransferase